MAGERGARRGQIVPFRPRGGACAVLLCAAALSVAPAGCGRPAQRDANGAAPPPGAAAPNETGASTPSAAGERQPPPPPGGNHERNEGAAPAPPIGAPASTTPVPSPGDAVDELRGRGLLMPVPGVDAGELTDTFTQGREGHTHEALDIMAPRGTDVRAVEDGTIVKLFTSKQGGLTVYQFDPTRRYTYYYAHLDRYAPSLAEGQQVRRGDVIGAVGSTGNASADAPHLHFAIAILGPDKHWWQGTYIDPYEVLRAKAQ